MPTRLHRRCKAFRRLDGSRLGPLSVEGGLISSFHPRVGAGSSQRPSPSLGREGKVVSLTPIPHPAICINSWGESQDSDVRAFIRLAWSVISMGHLVTLWS